MRGVGIRAVHALVGVACATASCGWPEFSFERDAGAETGGAGSSGAGGVATGGAGATSGGAGATSSGAAGGGLGPGGGGNSCSNGERDFGETGVDCGGGECPGCDEGSPCEVTGDCAERVCTSRGVCELLSCGDEVANGTETDEDCGGSDCEARCQAGAACRGDDDCATGLCADSRCVTAPCDPAAGPCGGAECPCGNGRTCVTHAECASANCAGGLCAPGARVFSRSDTPDAEVRSSPRMLFSLLVRNDAPLEIPTEELSLRYYFASDGAAEQRASCDAERAVESTVCDGVMTPIFQLDRTFADSYVEVLLSDRGPLAPGGLTSEVPVTIEPSESHLYDQSNDHSHAQNEEFAENDQVTLHRRGVLIYGTEPR